MLETVNTHMVSLLALKGLKTMALVTSRSADAQAEAGKKAQKKK
ncbi:hypothetical protein STRDD12_01290 [Streptococcus sp. DD12]|nr:hypothetical protein STRDD12_01290 [Streptococcus sp. DD12]